MNRFFLKKSQLINFNVSFKLEIQYHTTRTHTHKKENPSKKVPRVFSINPIIYFIKVQNQSSWFIICFKIDGVRL